MLLNSICFYRLPGYTSPQSGVNIQAEDGNVSGEPDLNSLWYQLLAKGLVPQTTTLKGNHTKKLFYVLFSLHVQLAPCFPDKAAQREVLQVEVQCNNKEYGCSWIGRLSDYIDVRAYY